MNRGYIEKPAGLEEFTDIIEENCFKADVYRWLGYRHNHYIVNLDRGNGRTTLVRYMTEMYGAWGVCSFKNSRRKYLEFCLDGSSSQLDRVFAEIALWAEHGDHFDGIVALDVTVFAHCAVRKSDSQLFERFVHHCREICDRTYFVFFTSSVMDKREIVFCDKLQSRIPDVQQVFLSPYTAEDIADIMEKSFVERGMHIEDYEEFHAVLTEFADDFGITDVREAMLRARQLAEYADTDQLLPVLNAEAIEKLVDHWQRYGQL